jgi:hypothetical protein
MSLVAGTVSPTTSAILLSNSLWRMERFALTGADVVTVPSPVNAGILKAMTINSITGGGTLTATFSDPFDSVGDTVLVFNAVRQTAFLMSVPDTTTSTGFRWELIAIDGATGSFSSGAQFFRQTPALSVTSSTVLVQTAMTTNVIAGKTYQFRGVFNITCGATGGWGIGLGGTATATTINFVGSAQNNVTTPAYIAFGAGTALGLYTNAAGDTGYQSYIDGTITVAASGTFGVQFTQKVSNGTPSVLGVGSFLEIAPTIN